MSYFSRLTNFKDEEYNIKNLKVIAQTFLVMKGNDNIPGFILDKLAIKDFNYLIVLLLDHDKILEAS